MNESMNVLVQKVAGAVSNLVLSVAERNSDDTCLFIAYQPDVPAEMKLVEDEE